MLEPAACDFEILAKPQEEIPKSFSEMILDGIHFPWFMDEAV